MTSIGILGLGSIGRRHARLLASLVPGIQIFACRSRSGALTGAADLVQEVSRDQFFAKKLDMVVISNPSSLHLQTLEEVIAAEVTKLVVVEKPFCLANELQLAEAIVASAPAVRIIPANCLRFHPAVRLLKAVIADGSLGEAIECRAHFGTFMPTWHPYEDYRTTYAAKRSLGGGVLLTSIHELDLMHHLFGSGEVAGALVAQAALRDTDVDDTAHLILTLRRCRVANVSLNFYERPADRSLKVVFERGAWEWQFAKPEVTTTKWSGTTPETTVVSVDATVDSMYLGMWESVLRQEWADFELTSVFLSLRTIAVAQATGEKRLWN